MKRDILSPKQESVKKRLRTIEIRKRILAELPSLPFSIKVTSLSLEEAEIKVYGIPQKIEIKWNGCIWASKDGNRVASWLNKLEEYGIVSVPDAWWNRHERPRFESHRQRLESRVRREFPKLPFQIRVDFAEVFVPRFIGARYESHLAIFVERLPRNVELQKDQDDEWFSTDDNCTLRCLFRLREFAPVMVRDFSFKNSTQYSELRPPEQVEPAPAVNRPKFRLVKKNLARRSKPPTE